MLAGYIAIMRLAVGLRMKKTICNVAGIALLYALCFFNGRHISTAAPIPMGVPYGEAIAEAAQSYDIHPALIAAVIKAESNFNPTAKSHRGARGLMQIIPSTQRRLRLSDAFDPRQNIGAGTRYLKEMVDTFDGDIRMALAAYNAGPGAVMRHDGIPPYRETRTYVKKVFAYYRYFRLALSSAILVS